MPRLETLPMSLLWFYLRLHSLDRSAGGENHLDSFDGVVLQSDVAFFVKDAARYELDLHCRLRDEFLFLQIFDRDGIAIAVVFAQDVDGYNRFLSGCAASASTDHRRGNFVGDHLVGFLYRDVGDYLNGSRGFGALYLRPRRADLQFFDQTFFKKSFRRFVRHSVVLGGNFSFC